MTGESNTPIDIYTYDRESYMFLGANDWGSQNLGESLSTMTP